MADHAVNDRNGAGSRQIVEVLRDLMIVELARAGIGQIQIREIVGVDMWRVSRIARHFKKGKGR
jgi:hypothetical protein